jgi:hypothetical protein
MIDKALLKMAKERIQTQEEELETLKGECVVGTGNFHLSVLGKSFAIHYLVCSTIESAFIYIHFL